LQTFLTARLQLALPDRSLEISTGLYGDFLGNLDLLQQQTVDCGAILLEWSDLDPRLGLRSLGGWRVTDFAEIVSNAEARLDRIETVLSIHSEKSRLAMSLPTLPLPPLQATVPTWRAGALELKLREALYAFASRVAANTRVEIVNSDWLDRSSSPAERFDVKSEMLNGFPYKLAHASAVSEALVRLMHPPTRKKALITDLDNTVWKGILGDAGVGGISWDLDGKSHMHAVYQELLRSLAATGVLLAVASKNDQSQVEEAFDRPDLVLRKEDIYPFEVHWNPKSQSVSRILSAWNIAADSVVFVDDNPAELAEVQAAHPDLECVLFPSEPDAVYELAGHLRNRFAKNTVTEEDTLRLASIRTANEVRNQSQASEGVSDAFFERMNGEVTLTFAQAASDPRVLELLNKTNQFNLNGKRYTEGDLQAFTAHPDSFVLKASYQDTFGPLGKVAVMMGRTNGTSVYVDAWVMSCRAFSRRIEHACLDRLFERFPVERVVFDFAPTARNTPLKQFFEELLGSPPESGLQISREIFSKVRPRLVPRVQEEVNG
jgi:FkbH-like protein